MPAGPPEKTTSGKAGTAWRKKPPEAKSSGVRNCIWNPLAVRWIGFLRQSPAPDTSPARRHECLPTLELVSSGHRWAVWATTVAKPTIDDGRGDVKPGPHVLPAGAPWAPVNVRGGSATGRNISGDVPRRGQHGETATQSTTVRLANEEMR